MLLWAGNGAEVKLLPQKSDEMLEMGCLGSGGSPSLEAFKERVDVVLRDVVQWQYWC